MKTAIHQVFLRTAVAAVVLLGLVSCAPGNPQKPVAGTMVLYNSDSTTAADGSSTYWPDGSADVVRDGVRIKRWPHSYAVVSMNSGALLRAQSEHSSDHVRWTLRGKQLNLRLPCYAGDAMPQIALSPDGTAAACLQEDGQADALYMIDLRHQPKAPFHKLRLPAIANDDASLAFVGDARHLVVLQWDDRHRCDSPNGPMGVGTHAVLVRLDTGRRESGACATRIYPMKSGYALANYSAAGAPEYSLDQGRHWMNGVLVGVADTYALVLEDKGLFAVPGHFLVQRSEVLTASWSPRYALAGLSAKYRSLQPATPSSRHAKHSKM